MIATAAPNNAASGIDRAIASSPIYSQPRVAALRNVAEFFYNRKIIVRCSAIITKRRLRCSGMSGMGSNVVFKQCPG
jgi:hypothetical protein